MGHWHDCEECKGYGFLENSKPTGNKVIDSLLPIRLLGQLYYYKQIGRLVRACDLLGINEIGKVSGINSSSTLFKSGDINILVMPCKSTYDPIEIEL